MDFFDPPAPSTGGGKKKSFLALKDGESIKGVFVGTPKLYYRNFKTKEYSAYYKKGFSPNFSVNFIIKEGDSYVSKLIEKGMTFYRDFKDIGLELKEEGKEIDNFICTIKRRGSGKEDTRYSIRLGSEMTEEMAKIVREVELQPLPDVDIDNEEIPF